MIRFFDYFYDTFRYTLYSIAYNKIENDVSDDVRLWVNDSLEINKGADDVAVYYTRALSTQPESIFSLNATYKIIFEPKPENDWKALTEEEIANALRDNALEALDQVASRMSLVLAEIMMHGNHEPLISPPNVICSNGAPTNA